MAVKLVLALPEGLAVTGIEMADDGLTVVWLPGIPVPKSVRKPPV